MTNGTSRATARRTIAAAPEVVYDLLADFARMGEWSPECCGVVGAAPAAVTPGTRFTGRNQRGDQAWETPCEVVRAERPRALSWVAGDESDLATTWTYELSPTADGGTEVRESFESLRLAHPDWVEPLAGRYEALVADLEATLAALAATAEAAHAEPEDRR